MSKSSMQGVEQRYQPVVIMDWILWRRRCDAMLCECDAGSSRFELSVGQAVKGGAGLD